MASASARGRQHGFVLALTLWILAAITIAAAIFSDRVSQAVELAQRQQQNTEALLDIAATRAEILFRVGVTPMSLYGLGTAGEGQSIALDNRPYRGAGKTIVQLQDNRGLLNLNIVPDERLLRLLAILDVPGDKRGMMIDTLRDYMDEDSLKRVNGAEAPEYRERKLPPPRNEKLLTPYEVKNIIGWRDLPLLWENNRLPDLTTISSAVAVNPNTAPKEVLATLPGVTNEIADAIIASRKLAPIATGDVVANMVGVAPGDYLLNIITLPADSIRITHRTADLPWAIQYNVSLQPNSDKAPWRIDYYYKVRQYAPAPPGTQPDSKSNPQSTQSSTVNLGGNPAASQPLQQAPTGLSTATSLFDDRASNIAELPPRHALAVSPAAQVLSSPH